MTENLFFIVAYLLTGIPVSLGLRFIGLPDAVHDHDGDCWTDAVYERSKSGLRVEVTPRKLSCNPRMGAAPLPLILWIMWIVFWPLPVAYGVGMALIKLFVKYLVMKKF